MIDEITKKRFEPVMEEFRIGIAHHRAEGATEALIKRLLGESIWLAFNEVEDPEVRAWLCDEFRKAALISPIISNHVPGSTIH